ncbi:MAG: hypothetical protein ABH867_04980 [Patescibacteria group bacterium]
MGKEGEEREERTIGQFIRWAEKAAEAGSINPRIVGQARRVARQFNGVQLTEDRWTQAVCAASQGDKAVLFQVLTARESSTGNTHGSGKRASRVSNEPRSGRDHMAGSKVIKARVHYRHSPIIRRVPRDIKE